MANGIPKKQKLDEQRRKKRAQAACACGHGRQEAAEGYPSTLGRETAVCEAHACAVAGSERAYSRHGASLRL